MLKIKRKDLLLPALLILSNITGGILHVKASEYERETLNKSSIESINNNDNNVNSDIDNKEYVFNYTENKSILKKLSENQYNKSCNVCSYFDTKKTDISDNIYLLDGNYELIKENLTTYYQKNFDKYNRSDIVKNEEALVVTATKFSDDEDFQIDLNDTRFSDEYMCENAVRIINILLENGFSLESACGVVGNAYRESHLNPYTETDAAKGLYQFEKSTGNWDRLVEFASQNNLDPYSVDTQTMYMLGNLESDFLAFTGDTYVYPNGTEVWWPEKMTLGEYKEMRDVEEATKIVARVAERPSILALEEREAAARYYMQYYKINYLGAKTKVKSI